MTKKQQPGSRALAQAFIKTFVDGDMRTITEANEHVTILSLVVAVRKIDTRLSLSQAVITAKAVRAYLNETES